MGIHTAHSTTRPVSRETCYTPRVVRIELFGVPRMRAGTDSLEVEARTLGEAFQALGRAHPELSPGVVDADGLKPHYLVAVNGLQLTRDPKTRLDPGDVVSILSAEAGG